MKRKSKSLVLLSLYFQLYSCCHLPTEYQFIGQEEMERYAEDRYFIAVNYMKKSRYELASQQFAIAAESAISKELKILAIDGYNKANKIIEKRR